MLANGSIAQVNPTTHPDLFWALRGGGNQFGIVTHFDLETYPQAEIWGGNNIVFFPPADIAARRSIAPPSLLQSISQGSFFQLGRAAGSLLGRLICLVGKCTSITSYVAALEYMALEAYGKDEYSQLYMSVASLPAADAIFGTIYLAHSKPTPHPPAFSGIRKLNTIYQTNRMDKIGSYAKELCSWSDPGYRQLWKAITIKANSTLIEKIMVLWVELTEEVKHVPGVMPAFVMQPIEHIAQVGSSKNGGNPFGIAPDSGPLLSKYYFVTPNINFDFSQISNNHSEP